MMSLGNFRVGNTASGESSPRPSKLNLSHLPRIPELGNENVKETSPDDGVKFRDHDTDAEFDSSPTGYSFVSWNDSGSDASHLSEVNILKSVILDVPFLSVSHNTSLLLLLNRH